MAEMILPFSQMESGVYPFIADADVGLIYLFFPVGIEIDSGHLRGDVAVAIGFFPSPLTFFLFFSFF